MDDARDGFLRNPRHRRRTRKWLLFELLPVVAIIVFLGVSLGVFWKRGKSSSSELARVLENLDLSVDPCEDFYEFACGGYLRKMAIPEDQVEVSMFTSVQDHLQSQLKVILEEPILTGELRPFQLAKNYYKSCMDKSMIESRGLEPMEIILAEVGGWPVRADGWSEDSFVWWKTVTQLQSMGFAVDYIMYVAVEADPKNSTRRTIVLDQSYPESALEPLLRGMPRLTEQPELSALLSYHKCLVEIAVVLGAERDRASTEMADVLLFYAELAKITLPEEQRRNMSEMYNPMTVDELQNRYPITPWHEFLSGMLPDNVHITSDNRLIVRNPTFFSNLTTLLKKTPARVLANYIISQVVVSSGEHLSSDIRIKLEELQSNLMGTTRSVEPWRDCVELVSESLWSSVGAMYVRKYFKEETQKAAVEIVKDIRDQFIEILKKVDWMDNTTRKRGLEKAAAMVMHVAYADELLDDRKLNALYKDLHVDASLFLESTLNISKFGLKMVHGRLHEKINKSEWISHSMPTIVNAFYSLIDNSIQIPAGILQGHFFNSERPWYMNYGAIGFVIGHEITHGFDDQGSQYDAQSNLVDWWEPVTKHKYLNKTQCIVEQYGNFTEMPSGLKLNGFNTQGENIADNGGIKEAYYAYLSWVKRNGEESNLPGLDFTPRQLFWISAAQTWCSKYRPHVGRLIVKGSEHSPGRFRVLGPLSNFDDFSRDFSCPLGSSMNPYKKCSVW